LDKIRPRDDVNTVVSLHKPTEILQKPTEILQKLTVFC